MKIKRDGKIEDFHAQKVEWSDGSLETDLPLAGLSEMFNCSFFIVSQVLCTTFLSFSLTFLFYNFRQIRISYHSSSTTEGKVASPQDGEEEPARIGVALP